MALAEIFRFLYNGAEAAKTSGLLRADGLMIGCAIGAEMLVWGTYGAFRGAKEESPLPFPAEAHYVSKHLEEVRDWALATMGTPRPL